jgi:tryptophan synthase alpha chain
MGRIEKAFAELKKKNEKALIFYLTAGDPDLEKTYELVLALDRAGVDILELGVPFSDPTADGPVIQAASQRALKGGASLAAVLELIGRIRKVSDIPIVLFSYYNPIFVFGNALFAEKAKASGVDGILVLDLPMEEAGELRRFTDPAGIAFVSLVAPTTDDGRIGHIVRNAGGFIYCISMTGVTGTGMPDLKDVGKDIERIKRQSSLPAVVGFGISMPAQAVEIARFADGIVLGSAFVKLIEENGTHPDLTLKAYSFAEKFRKALDGPSDEKLSAIP